MSTNKSSKSFQIYVKNIAQIHKWQMATPCYLMIDLKMKGGAATPQNVDGWLIVYGITGTHNNVSSSVLDAVYTIYKREYAHASSNKYEQKND